MVKFGVNTWLWTDSFRRDITNQDPSVRCAGIEYIKRCIDFSVQVGSTIFSGPMYSSVGKLVGRSVKDLLFHVHISENDRGIPGTGHVDWDGLFRGLQDAGYNGWLVIESFVPGIREVSKAAAIWWRIAPDGDAIAQEGLNFLKSKLEKNLITSPVTQ
jgi:sugar phosphate isomerase/epimerase